MVEVPVNSPGQIALQASSNLSITFALGPSFLGARLGFGIMNGSVYRNDVEGSVELAVTVG